MKSKNTIFIYIYFFVLVILFLVMTIPGLINECIPNTEVANLSFYSLSESIKNILIKKMDVFKAEHRKLVEDNLYKDMFFQFLPPRGYLDKMEIEEEFNHNDEKLYISKNKMRWFSNNLMSPSVWDEQNVLRMVYQFKPEKFDFNPHTFRYGGSWLYPMSFSLFIVSKIKLFKLTKDISHYILHPKDILLISVTGKSLGILSYIITICLVLIITKKFYNIRTSIFAGFFMVFCPMIIVESAYLKPLLSSLMWYILAVYFVFLILEGRDNKKKNAIYAGVCAGLAGGSLLPSSSIMVPVMLALTYNRIFPLREIRTKVFKCPFTDIKYFLYSLLFFFITFFLTNPYILSSYKEFLRELSWNIKDYHSLYSFWDFKIHWQNIIILLKGLGWPFGILTIASIVWAIINHRNSKKRIIMFAILSYYLLQYPSPYALRLPHALVPIIPLMILLSADFVNTLFEYKKINGLVIYVFIVLIAIYSFFNSLFYCLIFTKQPRELAGAWVNKNIPKGTSIGTFIDNCGLNYNYPYFNYFLYKFINDSDFRLLSRIKEKLPQYYIITHGYMPKSFTSPEKDIPEEYREYIDKDTRGTNFSWRIKFNEEKEIEPYYKMVAEFNSKVILFDKIFKNDLVDWWTKEIKIYRRK